LTANPLYKKRNQPLASFPGCAPACNGALDAHRLVSRLFGFLAHMMAISPLVGLFVELSGFGEEVSPLI
jgi:hypothetical protein